MKAIQRLAPVGLLHVLLASSTAWLGAQSTRAVCPAGPVALVLSGGGAKGIAHVGVIQHLDSLGVQPDLVVGTSMGALVGGMYASGWTGDELARFVFRFNVGEFIGGYTPKAPRSLGSVQPLLTWYEGESGSFDFSTAAVRESNVNLIVTAMMLVGNLRAAGDFDRLPIPFRAVAADLSTGDPVVLRSGDLAKAVRASFAIPLVFGPVRIGDRIMVDGGVAENSPERSARAEMANAALFAQNGRPRVILSAMRDSMALVVEQGTTGAVVSSLMRFLVARNPPQLGEGDIDVTSNTTGVNPLDFSEPTLKALLESGRKAAREMIPDASCLPKRRRTPATLPRLASQRYVKRPDVTTLRLAESIFRGQAPDKVPLDTLMDRVARLGSSELVRALWLNPVPAADSQRGANASSPVDSVLLAPELVRSSRRTLAAGIVYDGELGGRAWVGIVDRHLSGLPVELAVRGALGRFRQDALVALRRNEQNIETVRSPFVEVVLARERVRLFGDNDGEFEVPDAFLPRFNDEQLRLGVEQPLGSSWTLQVAGLARRVTTLRVSSDTALVARPLYVLGGGVRLGRINSHPSFVPRVELDYTNRYTRVFLTTQSTFHLGRSELGIGTRAVWADRDQPLIDAVTLGGDEGMAGLPIFARRGRSELSGAADLGTPLLGPLRLQTTLMGGQVSADETRPLSGDAIAGLRFGVGASTPVGPVRIQYSWNTSNRRAWYVRLGRWF